MTSQEFAGRLARAFRVYQARINEDVEQAELGRRVAVRLGRADAFSQGAVSRWFSGSEPRYAVVRAIAEELGVTAAWLAFGETTPSERETLDRAARELGEVKGSAPAAPADPPRRGQTG